MIYHNLEEVSTFSLSHSGNHCVRSPESHNHRNKRPFLKEYSSLYRHSLICHLQLLWGTKSLLLKHKNTHSISRWKLSWHPCYKCMTVITVKQNKMFSSVIKNKCIAKTVLLKLQHKKNSFKYFKMSWCCWQKCCWCSGKHNDQRAFLAY